jgi:rsbT co-antagonist protein RsbR
MMQPQEFVKMGSNGSSSLSRILANSNTDLLDEWVNQQTSSGIRRSGSLKESEIRDQCRDFLSALRTAAQSGSVDDIQAPHWKDVRELLTSISRSRGRQGFSPSETASFIFSLKKPLFSQIRREYMNNGQALADETWVVTELLDKLGLFTTEVYQKVREEVIHRQQQEMLELSTPVVKLWHGILALPMIGTLDSARTQIVMESLLQKIAETESSIAIIDITGVPTVDTLTAQHLIKTVTAARLMGAECIISGIRPQIAQTIVHLGVELGGITTKATLADAFAIALDRTGRAVQRVAGTRAS